MRTARLLMLGALGLTFAGAAQAANVLETMRKDPNLSTFVSMIDKSGVANQLTGQQKVTVLAPTNRAFDEVGQSDLRGLESNPERLRNFVLGHVVAGERLAAPGTEHTAQTVRTLAGTTLNVQTTGVGQGTINNSAKLVQGNIRADNGMIDKIDQPLGLR